MKTHRLIFTLTAHVKTDDIGAFARALHDWGWERQFTGKWLDTPEGVVPDDVATRPLILYQGPFEEPTLGITLLPNLPTLRVSYFVSPDMTPSEAAEPAAQVLRSLTETLQVVLIPQSWDLYGKTQAAPYVHLEAGRFKELKPMEEAPQPRNGRWN